MLLLGILFKNHTYPNILFLFYILSGNSSVTMLRNSKLSGTGSETKRNYALLTVTIIALTLK